MDNESSIFMDVYGMSLYWSPLIQLSWALWRRVTGSAANWANRWLIVIIIRRCLQILAVYYTEHFLKIRDFLQSVEWKLGRSNTWSVFRKASQMAAPSHVPTLPQCLTGTGAWQQINTAVKLHAPRYPVFDLQDGQKYRFRVYSVNLYGSSEASEPSEPIQKVDLDGKGSDVWWHKVEYTQT